VAGTAIEALRAGDPARALALVMEEVRAHPASLAPRLALFRIACIEGQWERARRQLEAIPSLDAETAMFAKLYTALIEAGAERTAVLEGRAAPVTIGEPPAFVAHLAQALAHDAAGEREAAAAQRRAAVDAASAVPGELDGAAFAWLMDADPRFGPCLELVVHGRYRWLPLERLRDLRSDGPRDLEDVVWLPVTLTLAGGEEVAAHLPGRYPGSEAAADPLVRLGRATVFDEAGRGLGGRLLASDGGDHPLMAVRRIRLAGPGDG
jgi:type VI secretion system protein ImpE